MAQESGNRARGQLDGASAASSSLGLTAGDAPRPAAAGWPHAARRSVRSWLPIPALLALMVTVHLAVAPTVFYDPAWLILLGNVLFLTGVSLVVCWVALRTYRATGRIQVLLLGCGVLIFGTGGGLAAAVRSLPDGANLNVTIYNTGALLGGVLHLAAAFILLAGVSPEAGSRRRGSWLLLGYGGSILVILLLTAACLRGLVPRMFVQGVGATPLRQWVLGGADVLFLVSSFAFIGTYLRTRETFLYWYACALALTAISLTAFAIQHSVGSPVGWVGRISQYVGGGYFLASLVVARRTARSRGTSIGDVLTGSLSGAEEKFRALAENAPDVIRRLDRELRHVYVNPAGQRLHGKPASAIVGKRLEEVGVPDDPGKLWGERVVRVFQTGQPSQTEEYLPTAAGTRFYRTQFAPEIGPDGSVANVLVLSHDLTQRKRAEDALREADRRKDDFLGMLSHELRNPLAAISNALYILDNAEPAGQRALNARAMMKRQFAHLTRIVDDLLDVTRIVRAKTELRLADLDLADLVRRVGEDHRAVMHKHGLEFVLELPDQPVPVRGDATRLTQVLGNLLHNAAKFTPAGGRVTVSLGRGAGRAEVRVRDTGAGIEREFLEHVFEPFTQGKQTLARSEGGLGLGLALVKGLVELHGGTVSAGSEGPGRGSEFVMSLPLASVPEGAGRTGPASRSAAPGQPVEVLVIEDNADAAESMALLLGMHGHHAHVATDGRSGIAKAREVGPDVVLCDIGLPDVDGYEVARTLRADPDLRAVRLIALSGYAQAGDHQRSAEAGFDAHLPKPPPLDALLALVKRAG